MPKTSDKQKVNEKVYCRIVLYFILTKNFDIYDFRGFNLLDACKWLCYYH